MLVELVCDRKRIEFWNNISLSCKEKYPENAEQFDRMIVQDMEEIFTPYQNVTVDDNWLRIPDIQEDFTGVYVCGLNAELLLERVSCYKIKNLLSNFRFKNYGVCDNASQAIEYYYNLVDEDLINEDNDRCIILLSPVCKCNQPEHNGWSWSDGGTYIGIQNPQSQNLYDEKNIDLVYVFKILKLEEQEEFIY